MEQKYFIRPSESDLLHYGVLGMKWGIRKQQNNIKLKDKPGNLSNIKNNIRIKRRINTINRNKKNNGHIRINTILASKKYF